MKKIIGIFPGNSSQQEKMFCELYEESEVFRQYFDMASEFIGENMYDLAKNISKDMLSDIEINSPVIVAGGYASFQYFMKNFQLCPECLIGHSLGEFTALASAGMISFKDVLKLVVERAKLAKKVKEKYNAGMCVINRLDADVIDNMVLSLRGNGVDIRTSCYNTNTQVCISGREQDLHFAMRIFSQEGAYIKMIKGNAPFHCCFMDLVKNEFEELLSQIEFSPPQIPVFSNWYGESYTKENIRKLLTNHLVQPIHWNDIVEKCINKNPDYFVEFGSNGILSGMMRKINNYVEVIDFNKKSERENLYDVLNN